MGHLPEETYLWREGALNLKEYWNNEMAKALFGYEMFEAHGEMMWIIDAETGRILDANRAAKAYYGYPDLVGMDVGEINMLSDEAFKPLLESASSKTNNQFHFKHRLGDGRVIEVDVSSYPMDVGGRRVLFSIMRDVTEEILTAEKVKRQNQLIFWGMAGAVVVQGLLLFRLDHINREKLAAQKEEIRQRAHFEAMAENSYDILTILDREGCFLFESQAVERILGYAPEQYIGKPFHSFVHPDDLPGILEKMQRITSDDGLREYAEYRMASINGEWVWLESSAVNLMNDPNIQGLLVSSRDVTERRQREEQLQLALEAAEAASEVKSRFLANMSHEIRTPMNGFLGMLQLMQLTELTDEQAAYVRTARVSAETMVRVVDDILDYSRLEAGKLVMKQEPCDLSEILKAVTALFQASAANKGLEIRLELPEEGMPVIEGDRARIMQVLSNLVGNAVKFTEVGGVTVSLQSEPAENDSLKLTMTVSDTGIGIPPENLPHIFDRFYQVDDTNTRSFGGSGLGLAISSQLARLMGGAILAEAGDGQKGSRFIFEWTARRLHR